MEPEEEESSNPSPESQNDAATTHAIQELPLPNSDSPQCHPEELRRPEIGGGREFQSSPTSGPETENALPDIPDNQDVVSVEGFSVVELSALEVGGGGGVVSRSPRLAPVQMQSPVAEKGESKDVQVGEVTEEEESVNLISPDNFKDMDLRNETETVVFTNLAEENVKIAPKTENVDDTNVTAEEIMEEATNNVGEDVKDEGIDVAEKLVVCGEVEGVEKTDVAAELNEDAWDGSEKTKDEDVDDSGKLIEAGEMEDMVKTDLAGKEKEKDVDVIEELWKKGADAAEELVLTEEMVRVSNIDLAEKREMAVNEAEELVVAGEVNTCDAEKTKEEAKVLVEVAANIAEVVEEKNVENIGVVDMPEEKCMAEQSKMNKQMEGAEGSGDAVSGAEEMEDAEKMEVEERDDEEELELADMGEETEMAEEAEKVNEAVDMEMAEEAEGEEEVSRNTGGKRKRGKNAKAPARISSKKKMEEDVCFICFDGGELVMCDRRGCPKAYHSSCVNHDDSFFQTKGRWHCGWHLCSNCGKNAYYMCYTCTFSLCKGCIKDAVIFCVRGNKGFCETCVKTVMMIESDELGDKDMAQVDFDDKNSWEYLFKDYWIGLKEKLSLTSEEIAQAKNPWKGSDSHVRKQELAEELYDAQVDGGSESDSSSGNTEVTKSKKRKGKKRLKSRSNDRSLLSMSTVIRSEGATIDDGAEWASKELLEFVMHMKNGDKSVCSQFDVQALLLEYIKRNKLRDPRRKSQIVCDSRLENLFGKPRVGHFEMLKLLESHFFFKEDSQVDDILGAAVDTEANQMEDDENSLTKSNKDKRRKSRKKGDGRGLQSNLDDYAAIDMHNINLIYLKRSLVENLIEDTEAFHEKVVGAFVRLRISGNAQKQDLYRLVQVVGTSKAGDPYKVGKRMTNFMLEILNLNKTETVSIDIISNQEFTEDECKRLRQSIKCGLINRLTVGDIQEKAMALQAIRIEDILESEITRVSHLRDRASDLGRRKELRECVEKLQFLKSPKERQRRLEEIPEIHTDPNMDPSYESDDDEGETDDRRQENYPRPRGSGFSKRGRESFSSWKGSFASNDSPGGTRSFSSTNRDLTRSLSDKGFSIKGYDTASAADEMMNENSRSHGRHRETRPSQSWEKPKTILNSETQNIHSVPISESVPQVLPEMPTTPAMVGTQSAAKINETDKIWHYRDPSGKIQGPFSMVQLRKWNNTGYFPSELRIWRITDRQDDSILLTAALTGNFERDTSAVDNNFMKTQSMQSQHLSSSVSGIAGESRKPQLETDNSTGRAFPAPLESTKNPTDRWGSETNLPSPTPAQTAMGAAKGQVYDNKWSPTQSAGSLMGANANPFSRGNRDLQMSHTPSSSKPSSHIDSTNISHGVSLVPKAETNLLLSSTNASQMHSQPKVPAESPRVQVNPHVLPAPNSSGPFLNAAIDIKSLQNLIQPLTTSNNPVVGTRGWVAAPVLKSEMSPSNVPATQAWGSTPSHKLEPNNSIPVPAQRNAYSNWGDAPTSVPNSASSITPTNPTGVSPVLGTSDLARSDPWRALPGQSNIQLSAFADIQNGNQRQVLENQNTGWGPIPANLSIGWGGPVSANSNTSWVAPGQGPAPGSTNPGWVAPPQGQGPMNTNPGWAAPMQGQAPGNAFPGWVPPAQGPAQVNANPSWVAPNQGPAPGNANPNWVAPTGNAAWRNEKNNNNEDRYASQRDRGTQGGDSGYGGGNKPWSRQPSIGRGDSSRPPLKGQRVCKYHENGHCKKGASCDYMHT